MKNSGTVSSVDSIHHSKIYRKLEAEAVVSDLMC
jgi:hypothetical protein